MEIYKVFKFDAAHYLSLVPPGHKCARMHGHSFRVEVHIRGNADPRTGWVMDFSDIAAAFEPILNQLDHKNLNAIAGLENPTSENLCRWIWRRLQPVLPLLCKSSFRKAPNPDVSMKGKSDCINNGSGES